MTASHRLFVLLTLLLSTTLTHAAPDAFNPGSLTTIQPDPESGFHHAYLIYIPESATKDAPARLLVEPNNTGKPDDDMAAHTQAAEYLASKSSVAHWVARDMGTPVLMPIFPRPMSDWRMYTHALDLETIHAEDPELKRLDLQLIAMIDDARARLSEHAYDIPERVLMTGFSASATFINRFVMLHPQRVAALAGGGFNAVLMLPASRLDDHTLDFPLGTHDYESIAGRPFDLDAVNAVPQLYFMGEDDTNDAVKFDDAYNADEREAVYAVLGEEIQPERWERTQRRCARLGLRAEYRTISGIGHGTNRPIIDMIVGFFREHAED